ncbi:MAG TPA: ATP-binding protein [Candidatus Limnocylindria bacterium]|nr:ATP-binding protein [Candidatus Limnocylindria bacterium]
MRFPQQTFERLRELLRPPPPDPAQELFRLKSVERDVVLPIKGLYLAILAYYFYFTRWTTESMSARQIVESLTHQAFIYYLVLNIVLAIFLIRSRRLSLVWGRRFVFVMSVLDAIFLSALTLVTGGFDSVLYWLYLGLIIRNAVSFPIARVQIVLNTTLILGFVCAGIVGTFVRNYDLSLRDEETRRPFVAIAEGEPEAEPVVLRVTVLVFMMASCYGLQVLFGKARLAEEENRESVARQEQLRAAGRLAAEIAHQIKNPLGIINNAAFALQRSVAAGKPIPLPQLDIIREEVARSDRIVTELMGYAQLAEGSVERLNVTAELNRAIQKVFPPGVYRSIQIRTDYADALPPLLMQRKHFSEIVVNILQNAREALVKGGSIEVSAEAQDDVVYIMIQDDGPGIPPDKTEKIFDAYFSTKEQGTGLGLSIVRHNIEVYAGRVRVESELGHGARFILEFPTRTFMKIRQ